MLSDAETRGAVRLWLSLFDPETLAAVRPNAHVITLYP